MYETIQQLHQSNIVKEIKNAECVYEEDEQVVDIEAVLKDNSELHIREKQSDTAFHYSYHWQDQTGKLLRRWDDAPHHKHLNTYPYHQHIQVNRKIEIIESEPVTIDDVILQIQQTCKMDKNKRAL